MRARRSAREPADRARARRGATAARRGPSARARSGRRRSTRRSRPAARSPRPTRSRRGRRGATAARRRRRAPSPRRRSGRRARGRPRRPSSAGRRRRRACCSPSVTRTNVPVPYVAFASPARSTPGRRAPPAGRRRCRRREPWRRGETPRPTTPCRGDDLGQQRARSTPNSASSSSSHSPVARSSSIVREALVRSVTCAAPPVSFHTSQRSIVPKASSGCGRSVRARIHSSFVAEKYGSGTSPVRSRIRSAGSSAQRSAVRRSCQTIAGCTGRPLPRSQTTVVSRWFVIPIASRSPAATPAAASASAAVCSTLAQISSGSCSTQPGPREVLLELAIPAPEHRSSGSTTRHVVPVVPWSIARITAVVDQPGGRPSQPVGRSPIQ